MGTHNWFYILVKGNLTTDELNGQFRVQWNHYISFFDRVERTYLLIFTNCFSLVLKYIYIAFYDNRYILYYVCRTKLAQVPLQSALLVLCVLVEVLTFLFASFDVFIYVINYLNDLTGVSSSCSIVFVIWVHYSI